MDGAAYPQREFEQNRGYLLGIAYRMLGSLSEAEDMVQETWIRWQGAGTEEVREPRPFLRKVITRLCLDQLKSARLRREEYVGPWLPEPLPPEMAPYFEEPILADDITMSLLLALERLTPPQRAAFLLHDIFEVPFAEVASILHQSEAASRQLAARARKLVQGSRKRFGAERQEAARLTTAFLKAARDGDVEALKAILSEDVIVYTDGGGKRPAAMNVLHGRDRATRLFAGLHHKRGEYVPEILYRGTINAAPGFITLERDGLPQVVSLEVEAGKVQAVYIIRNPDKLGFIPRLRPAP